MLDPDDKILIAMAKGNSKNIRMQVGKMSFREFGQFCSKPQQGGKHESYFTRGVPEKEEQYTSRSGREYGPGRYRHDSVINQADFLIIDADNSIATPKEVHDALTDNAYTHFMYTSHSHDDSHNNFRVVIPCYISNRDYMVATAKSVIDFLKNSGLEIEYTTEMGVWSQAWYLPTRDDPQDSLFEYYEHMEGTAWIEVQKKKEPESSIDGQAVAEDVQNINDIIDIISNGKDGMHHAMKSYSYGAVKDGQAKIVVKKTLKTFMMLCKGKINDDRWQTRYDDIGRLVDGIDTEDEDKITGVNFLNDEESDKEVIEIPWPPGLMGQFAKDMYASGKYPNKIMACTTVLSITAGISGRRFNISEMGLNLYITYLMSSGGGKNQISQFAKRVLNSNLLEQGSAIFLLGNEFSGAKSLLDELDGKRCGLSIQSESGFKRAKRSGDQSGLQGQILQLYSSSGQFDTSDQMMYSDSKNNTKIIQAPCLSIIEESTPNMYLDALREGTQTGQLNRMYIFRCSLEDHRMKREAKYTLDNEVSLKIKNLMSRSKPYQQVDNPDASHFDVMDEMYDFADDCKKESIGIEEENPAKFTMLQRSHEKAWKTAALVTLFNKRFKKGQREGLKVDADAWDWAKKLHEYEMSGLDEFFKKSGSNDIDDIIQSHIARPFARLLQIDNLPHYQTRRLQVSLNDRSNNRIPWSVLKQKFRSCRQITELGNAAYGKAGLDVILKYMEDTGYIKMNKGKYIIIKRAFFDNFGV